MNTALEIARTESVLLSSKLHNFVREAFAVTNEGVPFVDGYHIGLICEALEALYLRQIMGLIINVPPRYGKSTICTVDWPAWVWTKKPHESFLTASHDMKLSTRDAVATRRLMASKWYKDRWGDKFYLTSDQNTKTHYDNNRGGKRLAYSVGSGGIGEGGDYRILDDPHNPKISSSDAVQEAAIEWLTGTWASRKNDPKTSVMLCVMQRLAESDASNFYIDLGHEHLMLPARFEHSRKAIVCLTPPPPEITPDIAVNHNDTIEDTREDGDPLWPERFDSDELDKEEATDPEYIWNTQKQQRPSAKGGSIVKKKWWRYWTDAELTDDDRQGGVVNLPLSKGDEEAGLPHSIPILFQSWDATFGSKTKTASYVVGQLWGVKWPDLYLIDQVRGRMSITETMDSMKVMTALWASQGFVSRKILVEDKANGKAIVDILQEQVPGVQECKVTGGDKVARLMAVTPFIRTRHVYIPKHAEWLPKFLKELTLFPQSANDDQVDALSQAIDDAQRGHGTMLTIIEARPQKRLGMI